MKSILMSIRPEWVKKILNKEKTIEIRKRFPKDYVGWVYIYVTKNGGNLASYKGSIAYGFENGNEFWEQRRVNGKVVARFWCDKVEEIKFHCLTKTNSYGVQRVEATFTTQTLSFTELKKLSCLTGDDLMKYLNDADGYAIHVNDLEIFDKPKELSEFSIKVFPHRKDNLMTRCLTRAPESWCYIEI